MSVWRNAATPGSTSTTMPSDSGSSMAASPTSSATSSRSKRGPATLATSRTFRAAGDSGRARATTASRMLSGSGISSSPETSTPYASLDHPSGGGQRRAELFDEERDPLGPVVEAPRERWRRCGSKRAGRELRGLRRTK